VCNGCYGLGSQEGGTSAAALAALIRIEEALSLNRARLRGRGGYLLLVVKDWHSSLELYYLCRFLNQIRVKFGERLWLNTEVHLPTPNHDVPLSCTP
jgi:hypothetical protein